MVDTNEGFDRKYFLLNNNRQQECVLVCVWTKKKTKTMAGDPWHHNHEEPNLKKKTQEKD